MTIEAYVKSKQIALGRTIAPRRKVYLDLMYWIIVRDAALGLRQDAPALKLLHLLRRGVRQGALVCPIADNIFLELMKQPYSEDRRIGTARLCDELSLGVSLMVWDRRVGAEIYAAFHRLLERSGELYEMAEIVWTRAALVLGETHPVIDTLDPTQLLDLQRRWIDELWDTPLLRLIEIIGNQPRPIDPYVALSSETNINRDLHADEITSFERAYEIELRGAIRVCGTLAADALCAMAEKDGVERPHPDDAEKWTTLKNIGLNTLLGAFNAGMGQRVVRTLHIETSLHAAMRVDKARRFKPNDFYDFRHAAAALGYCDMFLTERPLHDLVRRKQLDLLALNDCHVVSDLEEAVEAIRALTRAGD